MTSILPEIAINWTIILSLSDIWSKPWHTTSFSDMLFLYFIHIFSRFVLFFQHNNKRGKLCWFSVLFKIMHCLSSPSFISNFGHGEYLKKQHPGIRLDGKLWRGRSSVGRFCAPKGLIDYVGLFHPWVESSWPSRNSCHSPVNPFFISFFNQMEESRPRCENIQGSKFHYTLSKPRLNLKVLIPFVSKWISMQ